MKSFPPPTSKMFASQVFPTTFCLYLAFRHQNYTHSPSQSLYFHTSGEIDRHQHKLRSVTLKNTNKWIFEDRQTSGSGNLVLQCVSGYRYAEAIRDLNYPLRKTTGSAREQNISVPHQIFHSSLFEMYGLHYTNYEYEKTSLNKPRKAQYGKTSISGPSWWFAT